MKRIPIGEVLKEYGYITDEQLQIALQEQKKDRSKRLGQHLIDLGFVNEEQTLQALSAKLDEPLIDLDNINIDINAVEKIPEALARKYHIIATNVINNVLNIVTNDPMNFYGLEDIRLVTGMNLSIGLCTVNRIDSAIDYYYSNVEARSAINEANNSVSSFTPYDEEFYNSEEDDTPVVKLLNSMLSKGYVSNVSDIHIEPFEKNTIVRMRIDGSMIESMTIDKNIHSALVVRTKILANLDISEKRIPQDGHFVAVINNVKMNLRVSIIPTVFGEKIVLRYLNSNTPITYSKQFGMDDKHYKIMQEMMKNPNGIVYVTGPTGSGKTTTLYMIMESLVSRNVNIVTIEDPVEKTIERINQMQVNNVAGLTFESGLRAILRQDPDIIMVGETRDNQTASISVRAAITGHLVVSTLHTNDALSTIVRLEDMGIEPYMVANSLVGVVAQRLVRKVCPKCGKLVETTTTQKEALQKDIKYIKQGSGCNACNFTGYKGRIAIHEMIIIDRKLRKMITDKKSIDEMNAYIKENQDFTSLKDEALKLVEDGTTSFEEYLKISYYEK